MIASPARVALRDIRMMWNNGARSLLIALCGLLAALLFFAGVSILAFVRRPVEFSPLDYKSPQVVLNPIVHPGDKLIVEAYKCNDAGQPIAVQSVEGQPLIRNLDTQALTPLPYPRLDAYVRAPGCPLLRFENVLPALHPGRYRLEGVDVATEGTKEQREAWFTAEFCVTDEAGGGC